MLFKEAILRKFTNRYKIFRNMYCFVEEKEFVDLEKSTFYKNIISFYIIFIVFILLIIFITSN